MILPAAAPDRIELFAGEASAVLALTGAEPMVWRIGDRDCLWHGDPLHWSERAPILFPVVGASADGRVRIGERFYPMERHGFARVQRFAIIESARDRVRLRLTANEGTRAHFPFGFRLDVEARLAPQSFSLGFQVTNEDEGDMPYALGFHPAFPWPFDGGAREDYEIEFEREESPDVPRITRDGLFRSEKRTIGLRGRRLPLYPSLFTGDALCFLDARSRSFRFRAPSGAAIAMSVENFPHLALWTKPDAPFLSMECWTGHGDMEGFSGDLCERRSMRLLAPGETARHAVELRWRR